ncbi:MAG: protein-glutamate methylesterase/protein-glutamine glutaminase [Halanaerobiales bacterium]
MAASKIKVLIIDDSALVREVLTGLLGEDKDLDVVGTARDPMEAIDKIKKYKPDVLSLDLQMPKMDGLTFLKKLMSNHPLPVIVVSSLTREGSKETLKAIELGAVDFVAKPKVGINSGLEEMKAEIIQKLKNAANISRQEIKRQNRKNHLRQNSKDSTKAPQNMSIDTTIEVIAIGASTGGTVAVRNILEKLPADMPGIIVVLHMPAAFTTSYAESLNNSCAMNVKEAENGEEFKKGTVYIAPGDKHLTLEQGVSGYFFKLDQGPKIHHVRPAVDKTFVSIADIVAPNCIGIILTGMGEDGAEGLAKMHRRNALTIAQDKETSVVFGMPQKAIEKGVVDEVLSLNRIPEFLIEKLSN